MHSVKATGPGFAYFQQVDEVVVCDTNTTGVAWVLDDVERLRLGGFTIGGVGTSAKPAAAINGRGKPWRRVEIDDGQVGVTGEIFGDGINFATGWVQLDDGTRSAVPVTGWIRNVTFAQIRENSSHPDCIQLAGASVDFMIADTTFRGEPSRALPSALQITPLQNHANDPGTGSGQSVGIGFHEHLSLTNVILADAGACRIFCAPSLTLESVTQTGHGTVDLRAAQGVVATPSAPWAVPHPRAHWTTVSRMVDCRINHLILDPDVILGTPASIPLDFHSNVIGRLDTPDGTPHPAEKTIRALLEREPPAPAPPPVDPPPPVDWEARATRAEERLARIRGILDEP